MVEEVEEGAEEEMSNTHHVTLCYTCLCVCVFRTCRCPAAACPAWLKSSEKTMANRDEASLC